MERLLSLKQGDILPLTSDLTPDFLFPIARWHQMPGWNDWDRFRQMKVLQLLKGEWLLQMNIIILLYGSIQLKFKFHDFLEIEFQSQGFATSAPSILLLGLTQFAYPIGWLIALCACLMPYTFLYWDEIGYFLIYLFAYTCLTHTEKDSLKIWRTT